jgi:hypothetical protein
MTRAIAFALVIVHGIVLGMAGVALAQSAAQPAGDSELKALYDRRQWTDLYRAVQIRKDAKFYQGVVAAVFGRDRDAEPLLRSVIRSAPVSREAYESYEWLTHIYFRTGQYHRLIANMEARWSAFPNAAELKKRTAALAGFRGLPDQTTGKPHPSTLQHDAAPSPFRSRSTEVQPLTSSIPARG